MDSTNQPDITTAITDMVNSIVGWIDKNWQIFAAILVIFVLAIVVSNLASRLIASLLSQTVRADMYPSKTDRDRRLRTLNSITTAIIHFIVWTVAILMILNKLGINTAPILASAGILGIALGFGAQSLIKDFMTGMFIIAENQYRVGDTVEIQNVKGVVKRVTMRTTVVQDADGSIYHIPNGSIIVTANRTMGNSRLVIDLSVTADSDLDKIEKSVNKVGKAMAESPEWEATILEPITYKSIRELAGGAMVVRVSGKVKAGQQLDVKSAFLTEIQKVFKTQKITLK